jgi:hypothetical protein
MLRRRWILLWLALIVVGGTLAATLTYGLYLRSDLHAAATSAALSKFFGLPAEVGSVVPLDLHSRLLRDVTIWLPDKREQVFYGQENVWQPKRGSEPPGYELRVQGGEFVIDSDKWGADDYRLVLESGLGHDFAALRLRRVELLDWDVTWRAGGFRLSTREANGTVILQEDGVGQASLVTRWLNEHHAGAPIHIYARFQPQEGVQIEQVTLDVPRISLQALGLEKMLGTKPTQGDFLGKVAYREEGGSESVELSGLVDGVQLEDLSGLLPNVNLRGRVSVQIDEGLIRDGRLQRLRFRGRIDDVELAPLATIAGLPDAGGRATLFVHQGEILDESISWLSLSGRIDGISLESLSPLIGRGRITGSLRVEVPRLVLVNDHIDSAELRITAEPPAGGMGLISRELLSEITKRLAGLTLPEFLPPDVEYAELGARVVVEGDTFRVLGTHGPRNTTLMTVRILGKDVGVLFQPARNYDLQPILDWLRQQAEQVKPEQIRRWWESHAPTGLVLPP